MKKILSFVKDLVREIINEINPKKESVYDLVYGIWEQPLNLKTKDQGGWSDMAPKPVSYDTASRILSSYKKIGNLHKMYTYSIRPRDNDTI